MIQEKTQEGGQEMLKRTRVTRNRGELDENLEKVAGAADSFLVKNEESGDMEKALSMLLGRIITKVLDAEMDVHMGVLVVSSSAGVVEGCRVVVDGKEAYLGALPARINVPVGTHTVEVEPPEGFEPVKTTVRLEDRGLAEVAVRKLPPPKPAVRPAPPPIEIPQVAKRPLLPPPRQGRATSALKSGLFWGGLATLGLAAGFNLWGYLGWKKATSGHPTVHEVEDAQSSARWKLYTAYGLYGVGGVCVITSFFAGHGRHPLGFALSPAPGGATATLGTTW